MFYMNSGSVISTDWSPIEFCVEALSDLFGK